MAERGEVVHKGKIGLDFELEARTILKNIFKSDKIIKIDYPIDYMVLDRSNNLFLLIIIQMEQKMLTQNRKEVNYDRFIRG